MVGLSHVWNHDMCGTTKDGIMVHSPLGCIATAIIYTIYIGSVGPNPVDGGHNPPYDKLWA